MSRSAANAERRSLVYQAEASAVMACTNVPGDDSDVRGRTAIHQRQVIRGDTSRCRWSECETRLTGCNAFWASDRISGTHWQGEMMNATSTFAAALAVASLAILLRKGCPASPFSTASNSPHVSRSNYVCLTKNRSVGNTVHAHIVI